MFNSILSFLNHNLHWFLVGGLFTIFSKHPDKSVKIYYYSLAMVWIVLVFLKGVF